MKEDYMKKRIAGTILIAAIALAGCGKGQITSPEESANLSMSIAGQSSRPKTGGGNALVIESAKILLKNIKLHKFPSDDSTDVKVGPFAVGLNLSGSLTTIAAARVPAGMYDRVRFRLHKPEDFEPIPDPEFRDGESGQLRYSVIVRGTYNGESFVYKSRENAYQETRLISPITVTDDQMVNVTLVVNPQEWFEHNGQVLNPADPANVQIIDNAIKGSFSRAFKDNNKDGQPD
jgi:hypothetical protein